MSNWTDLKRVSLAIAEGSDLQGLEAEEAMHEFECAATPDVVLALIAENVLLKAENEALRKLAIFIGLELRAATSWICREVESGTKSATHWAIRLRTNADLIDAAMGNGDQN